MKISVFNSQKDLKIGVRSVRKAVQLSLEFHQIKCDEISLHFVTDRRMRLLHQQFFDDPSPTDCISFPYDQDGSSGYFFLGEIFVCPKTALLYVEVNGGDIYKEITLYAIHGILHLLGFDDIEGRKRKIMRSKENELMDYLTTHQQIFTP